VTTFAGRGSSSINPNPWGYIDGDLRMEARFDQPKGLAYDEASNTFYVGDAENRRIRKISFEE
jgi:DNA-binding beta-propeller fold protein YncE